MGERGPAPKRSDQRRRANKPEVPITRSEAWPASMPDPDPEWHDVARMWYESLGESGQNVYYQASDWALAYTLAESMSRDLKPKFVGVNEETGKEIWVRQPFNGSSLAGYLKGMTMLLVTEADRRRASVELVKPNLAAGDDLPDEVTNLDEYRRRLSG